MGKAIRLSLFDGTDKIIDVNEEIEDKESHSGGDSKLVADYISYLETGKRPLGISELADSIQSHRLAFGAEEKRLEHPLPKISEAMACEKSVKNESSGGIYSAVSEFIGKNAENAVKTISMTVNCRKEDLTIVVTNICESLLQENVASLLSLACMVTHLSRTQVLKQVFCLCKNGMMNSALKRRTTISSLPRNNCPRKTVVGIRYTLKTKMGRTRSTSTDIWSSSKTCIITMG